MAFFEGKGLLVSGSWQSIWQEEHARAFTVANLARLDLLQEIHGALATALTEGQDYRAFAKGLVPKLQAAGWWNQPVSEGKPLGPQRLQLIYDTNLRTSYALAKWERIQRLKKRRPFLRYNTMGDARVRPAHRAWEGITRPVDDPFWDTHYPPNGWRCRCTVEQLSQADMDAEGIEVTPDGALPTGTTTFTNRITGEVTTVPTGIDPGWAYNVGKGAARAAALGQQVGQALQAAPAVPGSLVGQAAGESFTAPLRAQLGQWVQAYQDGVLKATGSQVVVGSLLPQVVDYLAAAAVELETAAISLSDRELTHMLRPPKTGRGAGWPEDMILRLPDLVAAPQAVYWDTVDPALLYVWPLEGQAAKAVIRVNYRVKSAGETLKTNLIKTTGVVPQADLDQARYERIV